MSYYFAIIGTQDNPLFEHEFGTSKQGGDGQARFSEQARHLNQFIVHSSLDIVEELQWTNGQLYINPNSLPPTFFHFVSVFLHRFPVSQLTWSKTTRPRSTISATSRSSTGSSTTTYPAS